MPLPTLPGREGFKKDQKSLSFGEGYRVRQIFLRFCATVLHKKWSID
jgi:hypothetical protein